MREKTHRIPSVDENLFEEYREISLYRPIPIFCPQFASTRSLNFDTFYLTNDLV